jgi:hypothetical protein
MRQHFWFAGLSMAAFAVVQVIFLFRTKPIEPARLLTTARTFMSATIYVAFGIFGLLLAFGRVS